MSTTTQLLTQNSKIKKTSKENNAKVFNFGIPSQNTCIGAKDCLKFCYASKGAYSWPIVKKAYEYRLEQTKKDDFPLIMLEEIIKKEATYVRVHDSGDFYSREYLHKWFKIADSLPHVTFYCYTKSIPLFLNDIRNIPENFRPVFSYGGKYDHLIDPKIHRHSRIFKDKIPKDYADASHNDLIACEAKTNNIGLLLH